MEITTLKNNNIKMGTKILKHGDFTLKYFKYCDIYFLFYKGHTIWDCEFNELFSTELLDYIFEREQDPEKATEFIVKLYQWLDTQEEAFKKILDSVYGEKI